MLSGENQRSGSDEHGTDACQKNVGTIAIRRDAQFAAQAAKPEDHMLGLGVSDVIHEQSCQKDQKEHATYTRRSQFCLSGDQKTAPSDQSVE